MKGKRFRTNRIIVFFFLTTLVVLCIATMYVAVDVGKAKPTGDYGLHIYAWQLSEKPQTYLTLTEVDSYVLEAISNLEKDVYVGSWEKTQIDDVLLANTTSNIEFNNHYYRIGLLSADPPPSTRLEQFYY